MTEVAEKKGKSHENGAPKNPYRWVILSLLFLGLIFSYVDRQTLGLLKGAMSDEMGWSNDDFANVQIGFQFAYAIFYFVWGGIIDRFGARLGYGVAFIIWSIAQIGMAAATSTSQFIATRSILGVGESGVFPASIKTIAQWFDEKERAFANGIFNSGSNIGAIITPIFIPMLALNYGWRAAFVATGLMGLLWLPLWLWLNKKEEKAPKNTSAAKKEKINFGFLKTRQAWGYGLCKALTDPVFGMYLVWLPDYFSKTYHIDLKHIMWPLIAIYLLSDVGSILGGYISGAFLRAGLSLAHARFFAMAICATFALPVMFAPHVANVTLSVLLIGVAAAAHQGFGASLYALPADMFDKERVGRVAGLGGLMGAGFGIMMSKFVAHNLDAGATYGPVFIVCGLAYWVALVLVFGLTKGLTPALK